MDTVLWALQAVLALKFVSVAYSHGLRPKTAAMRPGTPRFGAATRPLLALIGPAVLVGALCLILPGALGVWAWLTPWAAAVLAVMLLAAVGFHLTCRARPNVWVALVLCVLAGLLAYGRWVLVPFAGY